MPSLMRLRPSVLSGVVLMLSVVTLIAVGIRWQSRETARAKHPAFVGSARCATCHAAEYAAWKTSQHSMAMQEARPGAVLGRFDGTRFTDAGVTSTFIRRGDRYVVNTEGADG
ncbi:MAG: multiheme c-type cytochrome, partial [Gemmatimonas sp.]